MSKNKRSFRIVASSQDDDVDLQTGIYHGTRTNQVALKAFNWYCRKASIDGCVRRFTIEEITRNAPKKQFHYVGTRRKLVPPKEIERNGKTYLVHYVSSVRKAK